MRSGTLENLLFQANADYYRRRSDIRLFFASLSAATGRNLDADRQILLGGDNGLRGYPLRFQSGHKRLLLTLEERVFTDWYPLRLFRVGGAVFFDAGRAWGDKPSGAPGTAFLKNIGFGLRLGNPRSGLGNMAHVDLAFPLDGDGTIEDVQFIISVKESF